MQKTLLFIVLQFVCLTSCFGQASSDSIVLKKVAGRYGVYQNENKLNKEQFAKVLESNPEAFKQLKSARATGTFKAIITGLGVGMVAFPLVPVMAGKHPNLAVAGVGVGFLATTIPLARRADRKFKGAIKTYNNGLRKPPVLNKEEIKISMSGNGVGLLYTF